jgi:hypothetical protein
MPNYFPCPNAQCSYQFDADILPAAAMVTCPLCRTKFPYRANQPNPAVTGPGGQAPESVRPAGSRLISVRDVPHGGSIWTTILWVGGFCAVLAAVVLMLTMHGRPRGGLSTEATDAKFNISVEPFPTEWDSNSDAQKPVNANILGRKRTSPDAWIAVVGQDWVERQPRTGEVDELMRVHVKGRESSFSNVDLEPIEGESWANQPALGLRFSGTLDDAQIRGEAYAISHKGIAYVFIAWAAEANWQGIRAEAVGLREKIRPANYRDKWVEKRANTVTHDGGAYQIEDTDGAWVRSKPAEEWSPKDKVKYPIDDVKEIDPAATMAFLTEYRIREGGDSKRQGAEAKALVVELPGGGNPLEAAKAHVIERIKKDYAGAPPEIKLEPMNRSPAGVQLPTGGPAIGRFLFHDPYDRQNRVMYIISALSAGGKTVAIETHTLEKNASYVEEWMVHLAGSLKAK